MSYQLRLFLSLCCLVSLTTSASAQELDPSQDQWYQHYKTQENIPKPGKMLLNTDKEPELTKGFEPLFNGKDLAGWKPLGGTCQFTVEDGCIVGTCVPGSNSTYLSTEKADYTDFIFTCDMKWKVDGNTGVMFRAQSKPGKKDSQTVFGPQAEMEGLEKKRGWSGGIYGQSCGGYFYPLWLKEHAKVREALVKDEWNRVTISAQGNVVKTWVNGIPAAHWVDNGSYPKGFFSLQIHKGAEGEVLFRNLLIKK
ncbi:MAG: 3-keto-disaccharide hydrolase [Pirellulales bacterium]